MRVMGVSRPMAWEEVADYALNWAVEHAATFTHA